MRTSKIKLTATSLCIAFFFYAFWAISGFTQTKIETNNLTFKGKANKEVYALGEPVTVGFEFINEGETSVTVPKYGVEVGGLKIFIANKDEEYKEYFSGSWGRKRGTVITLEPKQSHKLKEATILWNGKPKVSHLNETAAKRILEGRITTEYAFPEPGVYFIKGVSYVGENATPIESKPIKIVVNEPTGGDLEVWNQIKGNKEIALLMQHGAFDTGNEAAKGELTSQVEQIVETHPNSVYSGYLKPNLEKFKAKEAKRNEFYKNIKQPRKPQ